MSIINLTNVTKTYESNEKVINRLNLAIEPGEFVVLVGPSGCGKTTILKMINRLVKPDSGEICIGSKNINEWNVVELRRSIGYVIQHTGLLPHLNVSENITFVLDLKKVTKKVKEDRARELIKLVGLDETFLYKYPGELSGGQKQRVGVARALADDPDIILMDEPFGAVDEINRRMLQDEIKKLHSKLNKTIIFVTHDIEEAIKLGNKIVVLNHGSIEQIGNKEELIFCPKNGFVKKFIGNKGYLAYLNITKINDVYKELDESCNCDGNSLKIVIESQSPLIEGIRMMSENKIDKVMVKNESENIIGIFDLSMIK